MRDRDDLRERHADNARVGRSYIDRSRHRLRYYVNERLCKADTAYLSSRFSETALSDHVPGRSY